MADDAAIRRTVHLATQAKAALEHARNALETVREWAARNGGGTFTWADADLIKEQMSAVKSEIDELTFNLDSSIMNLGVVVAPESMAADTLCGCGHLAVMHVGDGSRRDYTSCQAVNCYCVGFYLKPVETTPPPTTTPPPPEEKKEDDRFKLIELD